MAPAASIESLVAPGSRNAPAPAEAFVDADIMKGSGTRQAAAVVSGAGRISPVVIGALIVGFVALLPEDRPRLTPEQVKAILPESADRLPWTLTTLPGNG